MPKRRSNEEIVGAYFRWLLGLRGGVYFADGRTNRPPLGRHSLGTKDRTEALEALKKLDLVAAVQAGRADKTLLDQAPPDQLGLDEGWKKYLTYVGRPRVTGGAGPSTAKRYRPVGDKFISFAHTQGISAWNQVTRQTLDAYAAHLVSQEYAYASQYLELTTLKQALKFFVENAMIPATCRINLPMRKAEGTDTYCWTPAEVGAIIDACNKVKALHWLANVVVGLACTGLRISELVGLRWTDVNLEQNVITLPDERTRAPAKSRREVRTTKSGRDRTFPIYPDLKELLQRLPRAPDGLVFHAAKGGRIKPDIARRVLIRDVLEPLAKQFPTAAGERGFGDGRLHSFRHYFCSTCANQGVTEQVLMTWLGHSNSKMIKLYYHLHNAEAQRQMQKLTLIPKPSKKRSAG